MGAIEAVVMQVFGKGFQNLSGALDAVGLDKPKKKKTSSGAAAKDKLVVTPKGIAKKNARAALVVGSPKGVLSTEDQTATSGRGTLLGN